MLVDAHIHFESVRHYERLLSDMRRTGAEQFCTLVTERFDTTPTGFKQAEAIWLKLREPKRAFVFGGIDYSGLFDEENGTNITPLVEQLETLRSMGLDGVKLISGKPNVRHAIRRPLDSPVFEPMFNWLEATEFPVLWHVSDPPEFWYQDQVPRWAREKGWWYESFIPARNQIEEEISQVFCRHPRLNLILPHFFFLSDRLAEARSLLIEHPTFYLDLAPGVEMLHNFTQNREAAREFFVTFKDRIIFGTDIGLLDHCNSPLRGVMVRRFLETDDVFPVPDDPAMTPDDRPSLHGLALPPEVLDPIYSQNFHRVVGRDTPKPLNRAYIKQAVRDLMQRNENRGYSNRTERLVLDELS